jgi:flavin reductase (DIM6/NTAB) family NADH-FMN oxidoreductase RutF
MSTHPSEHQRTGKAFSARELRDALGLFATGVTVVTAVRPNGEPVGATANSFTSVSLDPPLLLWCLARSSSTLEAFGIGAEFAVHVLAHDQRELALHFARRAREKFEVDPHWRAHPMPPHVADVLCRFECRVSAHHPGGDHVIIVGEVLSLEFPGRAPPLAFFRGRFGRFTADESSPHVDVWTCWKEEWV